MVRAVCDWMNRWREASREPCRILLAVACTATCAEAPDGVQPEPPHPVAISVSPDSAILGFIGETAAFTATVTDQHGAAFSGTVTWRSHQPAIFGVSPNGVATAVSNGSGALSASLQGLSATARVTVRQVPATAAEAAGGGQEALPGSTLRDPIVVRVLDQGGTPTAGATIRFEPSEGHGSADPESDTTNVAGEASTLWTLGTSIGPKLLTARVPDGPRVRITATATVGSAVEVVAGNQQSALMGTTLRDPIVVRVLDGHGNPFPGTSVRFSLEHGNGTVTPDSVVTDDAGEAATLWTLGDSAGSQFLTATVPSGPSTLLEARGLTGIGICDRTIQVQYAILRATGHHHHDCASVTEQDLARVRYLDVPLAVPEPQVEQLSGISSLYEDDFRGLTSLERLILRYNDFASLPSRIFDDLPSLRELRLARNPRLSELPNDLFADLHNLTDLDLSDNRLETLPEGIFSGLSRLVRLLIGGNPIGGLPDAIFAGMAGLRVLHLISDCQSEGSGFISHASRNRGLSVADGGRGPNRGAFTFTLPAQSEHWSVEATGRRLYDETTDGVARAGVRQACLVRPTSLRTRTLSGLASLDTLSIGGWFDEIPGGAFSDLSSLRSLVVAGPVVHLADGAFIGLTRLERLHLETRLGFLPSRSLSQLGRLRHLRLRMPLEGLEESDFTGLGGLQSITLAGTGIDALPGNVFARLGDLRFVGLWDNHELKTLHENTFGRLPNLDYIWMSRNGIAALPEGIFSGLRRMRYLSLEGNAYPSLPGEVFADLVSLEQLAITEDLTQLPSGALSNLSNLEFFLLGSPSFGFTPIELPNDLFAGHQRLRYIIMRGKLSELPPSLFSGLSGLQILELGGNRIQTLPQGTFVGLEQLTRLNLCNNPGAPFGLQLLLKRTDTADNAAPGPATMRVRLAAGAPFDMSVPISAPGATLSPSVVPIAKGDSTSSVFSVTRRADHSGTVAVSVARVPGTPAGTCRDRRAPNTYLGLEVVVGDAVRLFK